jgi:ParB-like chromosome segregation protein Spo0J
MLTRPEGIYRAATVQDGPPLTAQIPFNWRAHLHIHPAAELFPLMAEVDPAALKELAEDIKVRGLVEPIVGWAIDGQFVLDGRNRVDALALLGLLYETEDHHVGCKKWDGKQWTDRPGGRIDGSESPGFRNLHDGDPYEIALALNVHRRHLTNEDKDRLIAELIKANPEKSNRQIAAQVKVASHPTVAKVRAELEKTGDVETVSTSIDTKGRKQPAKRKGKAGKKSNSIDSIVAPSMPIGAAIDVAPEAKPNGKAGCIKIADTKVAADASRRALKEFKYACDFWLPKINRDDQQAAIAHFCKVAGLPAIGGGGVA